METITEIIPNLYLGSYENIKSLDVLYKYNIELVINVASECVYNICDKKIEYYKYFMYDNDRESNQ